MSTLTQEQRDQVKKAVCDQTVKYMRSHVVSLTVAMTLNLTISLATSSPEEIEEIIKVVEDEAKAILDRIANPA